MKPWRFSRGRFCPPGDTGPCLKTFVVVMTGRGRGRLPIAHSAKDSPTENDVTLNTHRVRGGRISAGEV